MCRFVLDPVFLVIYTVCGGFSLQLISETRLEIPYKSNLFLFEVVANALKLRCAIVGQLDCILIVLWT